MANNVYNITEIVGTRVRIRPVCGLPLMHMERPELTGIRRLAKDMFDKAASALGILFLLLALVALALAVPPQAPGPDGHDVADPDIGNGQRNA